MGATMALRRVPYLYFGDEHFALMRLRRRLHALKYHRRRRFSPFQDDTFSTLMPRDSDDIAADRAHSDCDSAAAAAGRFRQQCSRYGQRAIIAECRIFVFASVDDTLISP